MPDKEWQRRKLVGNIIAANEHGLTAIAWNPYAKTSFVSDYGVYPYRGIAGLSMDVRDLLHREGHFFSITDLERKRTVETISVSDFLRPDKP